MKIRYKGLAVIITFRKFAKAMAPLTFGKFPIKIKRNRGIGKYGCILIPLYPIP